MAATIIHFGVDLAARVPVLESAGFEVDICSSIDSLMERVQRESTDAVVVPERQELNLGGVITVVRSYTLTSLVLFAQGRDQRYEADFDLIIEPFTPPQQWVKHIAELIAQSKVLQAESRYLQAQASTLRGESRATRQQIVKQYQRARELRKHFPSK